MGLKLCYGENVMVENRPFSILVRIDGIETWNEFFGHYAFIITFSILVRIDGIETIGQIPVVHLAHDHFQYPRSDRWD